METYNEGEIVNIGSGDDVEIKALAEIIQGIVGYEGTIVWDSSKPDGTPRKVLDVTKLESLGWKPTLTLQEGIETTYAWAVAKNVL
jgi:GDP-L-fucose synthase